MDSILLLMCAKETVPGPVVAITARSEIFPAGEQERSVEFCKERGIKQIFADMGPDFFNCIKANEKDICYTCKKALYKKMLEVVGKMPLADGTNIDDLSDYRPGLKALEELNILTPLQDVQLTKDDIRIILDLVAPNVTPPLPSACLASRIAHGDELTPERLMAIDNLEDALKRMGFDCVRVRSHGDLARIEVAPEKRKYFFNEDLINTVSTIIKDSGFTYATLDMDGYEKGSMNRSIK